MKTFALVTFATLLSTAALAQDSSLAYRGSGNRAGGPAYLLNSGDGARRQAGSQPRIPKFRSLTGARAIARVDRPTS